MKYLMILPVEFFPVSGNKAFTESAFCEHLKMFRDSLEPELERITILAPQMSSVDFDSRGSYLGALDENHDRIRWIPLEPARVGRLAYLFRYLIPNVRKIYRAVKEADIVHAGPSHVYFPREIIGILLGRLFKRKTVFVVDIDWRNGPIMNRALGRSSRKSYLLHRYLYSPVISRQVRFAVRHCSLVLLKSPALVAEYGEGRQNVKNVLDAAHSAQHISSDQDVAQRLRRLRELSQGLRLVYFGRLTAYKGIDRMIRAVASLAERGNNAIELTIIGIGEQREALVALTRELGVTDRVQFVGAIPFGPALFSELRRHDLLLAAPLTPDTPRSALDAMAAGLTVLAFDTPYYRDLHALGGAVVLSPWPSVEKLAEAVANLASDPEKLQELTTRAVRFAAQNTQEIWLERRAAWTRLLCMPGR